MSLLASRRGIMTPKIASGPQPARFYPQALLPELVASGLRNLVSVTSGAAATTVGTKVEVDASLSAAIDGINISIGTATWVSATNTSTLLYIYTGASGSEVLWATCLIGYGSVDRLIQIPGYMAAGTRVSVAVSSQRLSQSYLLYFSFLPSDSTPTGVPVTYGVTIPTTTNRGTSLTVPGSVNTKSAWTQLTASTSATHSALMVSVQYAGSTTVVASGVLLDIGIGGAGAETVLIPDLLVFGSTSELGYYRTPMTYNVNIPSGSRLSARFARASASNALDVGLVAA